MCVCVLFLSLFLFLFLFLFLSHLAYLAAAPVDLPSTLSGVKGFQTDNGAPTPACGGAQGGQNYPLRGGKCSAWEGGLRGTAFVHSPLLAKSVRGSVLGAEFIMHTVDVLPTLLSAAHGHEVAAAFAAERAADGFPLDGVDMWSALSSAATAGPRVSVLLEFDQHVEDGYHHLYCGDQHGEGNGTAYYAVRSAQWKLLLGDPAGGDGDGWYCSGAPCPWTGWNQTGRGPEPLNRNSVQLFDVVNDREERVNEAAAQPKVVKRLIALLHEFNATGFVPSYVCGPGGNWKPNGTLTPWVGK